jgi:hypothetical protein
MNKHTSITIQYELEHSEFKEVFTQYLKSTYDVDIKNIKDIRAVDFEGKQSSITGVILVEKRKKTHATKGIDK